MISLFRKELQEIYSFFKNNYTETVVLCMATLFLVLERYQPIRIIVSSESHDILCDSSVFHDFNYFEKESAGLWAKNRELQIMGFLRSHNSGYRYSGIIYRFSFFFSRSLLYQEF